MITGTRARYSGGRVAAGRPQPLLLSPWKSSKPDVLSGAGLADKSVRPFRSEILVDLNMPAARTSKPAASKTRRRSQRLWWLLPAFVALLLVAAAVVIRPFWRLSSHFDEVTFRQPSRLYGRATRLYEGRNYPPELLTAGLADEGYREDRSTPELPAGRYRADARGGRGPPAQLPPAGRQPGRRAGRGRLSGSAHRRPAPRRQGDRLGDPRSPAPRLLLRPQPPGAPAGHPRRGLARPDRRHPRRRGRDLLPSRRGLAHRHRARHLGRPARQRGPPGGEHADPATGQEPLSHPGADADAQEPGDPPRRPARDALPEEEDPRGLPQRDLPGRRQRRLADRRRLRLARLLRQGRGPARPRRGGDARRDHPLAGQLLADHPSGPRPRAARLGAGPPRQAGSGVPSAHRPGAPASRSPWPPSRWCAGAPPISPTRRRSRRRGASASRTWRTAATSSSPPSTGPGRRRPRRRSRAG